MNNLIAMLKNWKTTVLGFIPFLAGILNYTGVISIVPEEALSQVGHAFDGLIAVGGAIVFVIGLVSRDADKSSKKTGLKE